MTEDQIAALYDYSLSMVRYIRRTAQRPDLHGLDEQTALAAAVAGVPLILPVVWSVNPEVEIDPAGDHV